MVIKVNIFMLQFINITLKIVITFSETYVVKGETCRPGQNMPPHEIKTDNNMKNALKAKLPVIHLCMQSSYHHTQQLLPALASQNLTFVLMPFLHVLT